MPPHSPNPSYTPAINNLRTVMKRLVPHNDKWRGYESNANCSSCDLSLASSGVGSSVFLRCAVVPRCWEEEREGGREGGREGESHFYVGGKEVMMKLQAFSPPVHDNCRISNVSMYCCFECNSYHRVGRLYM